MSNGNIIELRNKNTGEIIKLRRKEPDLPLAQRRRQRITGALPGVGQFAGGIAGGFLGARVAGRPFVGGAAGGTIGRGIGEALKVGFERAPVTTAAGIVSPLVPGALNIARALRPQEPEVAIPSAQAALQGIREAAPVEAITGLVGGGVFKVATKVGRGILGGLLGKKVADRGFESGWKAVLNPEFYKRRVPKSIAEKTNQFFNRLTDVSGKEVGRLMRTKYRNVILNVSNIKNQIRQLLPPSGNPVDLLEQTAPAAQKNLITDLTQQILGLRGNTRKAISVWELRKTLDKAIFGRTWTQDASRYLRSLRQAISQPIRGIADDVGRAFDKYSFVKSAEDDLGKQFSAIKDISTGETYALKVERFVSSLLGKSKDDAIRLLRDLDKILGADDKVITDLLNFAAAESLEQGFGIGIWQNLITSMLGGRKALAGIAAGVQRPLVQAGRRVVGRLIPTAITEQISR